MPSAARASKVRQSNLALVVDVVRRRGPMSRSALVAATGLTRSAIAGLLAELTDLHLVYERPAERDGSPGRPSPIVHIDDRHLGALAIEVFVDEISVSIVSLDGTIVTSMRRSRSRKRLSLGHTVRDVAALVARVDGQRRSAGRSGATRQIVGIGVSVPGLIRRTDNTILVAPNLGWVGADLAAPLAELLDNGLPIRVGNDADLGAVAEYRFGAGVGAEHMLYVSGEVGVGGGVIIGGQPLMGRSGSAGEIGHFPVNPDGIQCGCGAIGCWETEVGERALLRRAGLPEDGGTPAVDRLIGLIEAGDAKAHQALRLEARWLAIGLTGFINTFDPDRVVLGGLLGRLLPYLRTELDEELEARRFRDAQRTVPVLGAQLGGDATTVGAAELAFGSLLDDPARALRQSIGG
jgi:predicted NBD/HSP70 family sugar kinase